jgi:hypothetical protein
MEIGVFVQENKRWLLGCALGGVVFIVARMVIQTINDPRPKLSQASALVSAAKNPDNAVYDDQVRVSVTKEADELKAERARLESELAFTHDPAWLIEGQGQAPDEYLGKKGRELKGRLQKEANKRAVDVADDKLKWPSPTAVDDVRAVMFGLEIIDTASQRLWLLHDQLRKKDPTAQGLRSLSFLIEDRRSSRNTTQRQKAGEVDLRELVEQQRVLFEIRGDAAVVQAFLESCRQPGKTLALESLLITPSLRRGEPLLAKGALLGIAFKAPKESN